MTGLFLGFRRAHFSDSHLERSVQSGSTLQLAPGNEAAGSPPRSRRFELRIKQGRLESGKSVIRLTEGDSVTLVVISDYADEFHLHGYDLTLQLRPNLSTSVSFVANLTGRFPYELHRENIELGVLEVYPR